MFKRDVIMIYQPLPNSADELATQRTLESPAATGRAIAASGPGVSVIVPTYRRADVLVQCLTHLYQARPHDVRWEILIFDNGWPELSRRVVEDFHGRLPVHYTANEPGHGLGYSLLRGARQAAGDIIIEMNDDALIPPNFIDRILTIFNSDRRIGVVGVRAIEQNYASNCGGISGFNDESGEVVGNFNRPTAEMIDVDHVYGFCYAYRRELLERGGGHDEVLLAQDYSSGNRIETDHCLTARKLGYRVVYDGRIAVEHLAKPRADMSERSPKWKLNHTRNTLYLYLKHFGWFGRRALALRFCFLIDLGLRSALLRPSRANWGYFFVGIRARVSAVWHWARYLASRPPLKPIEWKD